MGEALTYHLLTVRGCYDSLNTRSGAGAPSLIRRRRTGRAFHTRSTTGAPSPADAERDHYETSRRVSSARTDPLERSIGSR